MLVKQQSDLDHNAEISCDYNYRKTKRNNQSENDLLLPLRPLFPLILCKRGLDFSFFSEGMHYACMHAMSEHLHMFNDRMRFARLANLLF